MPKGIGYAKKSSMKKMDRKKSMKRKMDYEQRRKMNAGSVRMRNKRASARKKSR